MSLFPMNSLFLERKKISCRPEFTNGASLKGLGLRGEKYQSFDLKYGVLKRSNFMKSSLPEKLYSLQRFKSGTISILRNF